MKNISLSIVLITMSLSSCNSNKSETQNTTAVETKKEEMPTAKAGTNAENLLNSYLALKNALTKDDDKAAAQAGKDLTEAFKTFDKTTLSPEQAKVYTDIEEDAREHAEHIGANAGNIKHQREHFETLSQDMFELVKSVDTGRKLYYDHCPMYNDNKGGYWVSETKEILNPYLGKEMLTCGVIKEELK